MKINHENYIIEMSKKEAKCAGIYDSETYKLLMNICKDFPTYKVIVKESAKRTTKTKHCYKGLTFKYMETYIKNHSQEDTSILMEFYKRTARSDKTQDAYPNAESYFDITSWFFHLYPEIKNYYEMANK